MGINEKAIKKEVVEGNILTVEVEVKIRRFARDKKYSYYAVDILPVLEKKYKIKEIIKNQRVCNFLNRSKTINNCGIWKFLLDEEKRKPRRKKSSTNSSIRDRINKVVKIQTLSKENE